MEVLPTDALHIQCGVGKLFVLLVPCSHKHYFDTQCLKSEQQHYVYPDTEGSCACLGLQASSSQAHLPYVKTPGKKNEGHKH